MNLRPYQPEDAAAWLEVANTVNLKPVSMERFLENEQRWRPEDFRRRWVAEQGGRVAAIGTLAHFPFAPEGYLVSNVATHPDARGKGLGSALLAQVEETARERAATGLVASVRDNNPEARAWAERRGYAFHAHRFESVLDLEAFDEPAHLPVLDRARSLGVAFTDMAGRGDADWDRLLEFFADRLDETPDMRGVPRWTPERVSRQLRDNPNARPEWVVLAGRGAEWLGLTVLSKLGDEGYNLMTGVRPEHRGLGLARALKVEIIRRARAAGFQQMRTNNLSTNAAMLAVNRALGYVPQPGTWELRKGPFKS